MTTEDLIVSIPMFMVPDRAHQYPSGSRSYSDAAPMPFRPEHYKNSPGSVRYRLNVNYKAGPYKDVSPLSAYVNDQPFNLPSVDASTDKYTSVDPDCTQDDHAFEVVTDAFVKSSKARSAAMKDSVNLTDDQMAHKVGALPLTKICRARLIIQSPLLRKALGLVIRYYPDNIWISDPSRAATISEPYSVLFHHYREIEDFISRESNKISSLENDDAATQIDREKTVRDMALLLNFLKPTYESTIVPTADLLTKDAPMVAFDMLWYLFRPGTDVWFQGTEDVYMAVVHRVEHKRDHEQQKWSSTRYSEAKLHLWCLDTDGNRVARISLTHVFARYTGQVEVTSLAVCPVSYWDATDQGARRRSTLAKSQLLVEAIREGSLHVHYDKPNDTNGVVS
jgi:hypothetical protein